MIYVNGAKLDVISFPGGERNVKLEDSLIDILECGTNSVSVSCYFRGSDDIIDLLLVSNAIRSISPNSKIFLKIPYFPAARDDRLMVEGQAFGLQVYAQMIKLCNFEHISVVDPHSDVLGGMFEPGKLEIKSQTDFFDIQIVERMCLVAPDSGAVKKAFRTAQEFELPLIEASKKRDVSTGEITSTYINPEDVKKFETFVVVDDICDGGRTFIELAKAIEAIKPEADLKLMVTHGLFTKGKEELLKYYSEVKAAFDWTELK